MDIKQLTSTINTTESQLEQQINHLQQQLLQANEEDTEKLNNDLKALEQLQHKLAKSRELALRAHALQTNQSNKQLQQKRRLGIGLCIFSAVGLIALMIIVLMK